MTISDVPPAISDPLEARLSRYHGPIHRVLKEVSRVFIGPEQVIEGLLVTLFASGHALLEGVPGVAKTTLVRAFSRTIDAEFKRIQFTPDMLPSDITGVYIPNLQTQEFVLRSGPIFANVVLGDEINRAPAKTQSALLEAMQEHQVTIEGVTHRLPEPFMVLATQNPIEQEGVYELPEAQLDRFLMKLFIEYPSAEQEINVLKTHHRGHSPVPRVLTGQQIMEIREIVDEVHLADELSHYIVKLVRFTRDHPQAVLGASPRAALALLRASKARAVVHDRTFVLPDDVRALATSVLSHRIIMQPEAELSGVSGADIVKQALQRVRYSE